MNVDELREEMERQGVQWEIREEPLEAEQRLGYMPSQGAPSLEEQEEIARRLAQEAEAEEAPSYPEVCDLRDLNGRNFVTAVKDQKSCGSCVAFGSCAAVEGVFQFEQDQPDSGIDLSEAELFYCAAHEDGFGCDDGWYPKRALSVFKQQGVPPESVFPYSPGDQDCQAPAEDWQDQAVKIEDWQALETPAEIKQWISEHGPAVASLSVYEDFQHYGGGIYKHVAGRNLGGHCVCAVGYNDKERYWVVKNSWNTGWGEDGFFRIAYGEVGIDSAMLGVQGVVQGAGADEKAGAAAGAG
jgi:C1A family cysteine protease